MLNVKNRPVFILKSYESEEYCFSCSNFGKASNVMSMTMTYKVNEKDTLRGKCPNAEFFLVHIFQHSDWKWRFMAWGLQLYKKETLAEVLSCEFARFLRALFLQKIYRQLLPVAESGALNFSALYTFKDSLVI